LINGGLVSAIEKKAGHRLTGRYLFIASKISPRVTGKRSSRLGKCQKKMMRETKPNGEAGEERQGNDPETWGVLSLF